MSRRSLRMQRTSRQNGEERGSEDETEGEHPG